MGKKSSPKAPDLSALAAASELAAELGYKTSQEQLAWAREMWDQTKDLLGPVLDIQQKVMENNYQTSVADRARYEEKFQALEDNLIQEFQDYDSPERRAQKAGEAQAQVRMSNDAAIQRNRAYMQSFGIQPGMGLDVEAGLKADYAAREAAAANMARKGVEDTGRALRAEAINIGRGMPSQVAASYGQALNAGNAAVGNMNNSVQTGAGTMGTGLQWGAYGLNATGQGANIRNSQFQNELASFESQGSPWELAAMGIGAAAGAGGYNAGGPVAPEQMQDPQQRTAIGEDSVPAELTPGEYVFPKEAAMFYGTEKLDKMVAKARDAQGIPDRGEPAPQTPLMANVGGTIPPMGDMNEDYLLANQFAQNQGIATRAEDFRLNLARKREANEAQMQQAAITGGKLGQGIKGKMAPPAVEPPAAPQHSPVAPKVALESAQMSPAPVNPNRNAILNNPAPQGDLKSFFLGG